ncbi:hypothetical protein ILYODFUR_038551 [Ilyodon furcidens]|uniref:Uncharacterized protein n=1 Tax=Ilyodon furcidens TaxID=33524 RepID=A0ABV0UYW4_9TELE
MSVRALVYTRFLHKNMQYSQTRPPGPGTDTEEIRTTDIQRPARAQEPHENHRRDYHNPPREEQRIIPGEPPSSHSAEAPGSCSPSRSSKGPRDPSTWDISLPFFYMVSCFLQAP